MESNSPVFKDIDFDPKFTYFASRARQTSLQWRNLSLTINPRAKKPKNVLSDVSGHVEAGTVCALMGPSGAGKSSLLNVLAGRVVPSSKKQISGEVLVNNVPVNPVDFRTNIAYVMQEDLLYATSTAREALEFSARLRLPKSISNDSRKLRDIVDDLLESLGLTSVQNTYCGSERMRGLSGGEKKRVAIGIEIITNPAVLFLDEPTSGLDSFNAWKVIRVLESLGKNTGCAVLCTIHQPSSEIFNAFHNLVMLCRGKVMYNGQIESLPKVFANLGFPIPERSNPADFITLLAQTIDDDTKLPHFNIDEEKSIQSAVAEDGNLTKLEAENHLHEGNTTSSKAGLCIQAALLARRELLNLKRDYLALVIGFVISLVLALIYGIIFLGVADRSAPDFQVGNLLGSLVLIVSSVMFSSAQGPLLQFPLERGIFLREYRTGTYGAVPYLLAKLLVELPRSLVNPIASLGGVYWLIGFEGNFLILLGIVWTLSLAIASYAVALGSALSDPEQAQQFSPLIIVPQLLFAGLFVPISAIPDFISWAQYLCVLKYAVNLGLIVELQDCEPDSDTELLAPGFEANCTVLFAANDISSENAPRDILIIFGIFVLFRSLSLIFLVRRSRF